MSKKALYLTLSFLLVAIVSHAMPFERELDLPDKYKAQRVTRLLPVEPGETATLLDLEGSGCITHIWMTSNKGNDYRKIVLRMYWDGEEDPSVEAPLADFFGIGHGRHKTEEPFANECLVFSPFNGYNCYFPMPFRESARITITNDQNVDIKGWVYFQADWRDYKKISGRTPYFHAQWRREAPGLRRARPYSVIQAVGEGFLAGMTYHLRVDDKADDWCHGGGDTVYYDAQSEPGCVNGIGGEDYFGASWGIDQFTSPYAGCIVNEDDHILSMYRFYLESPIPFEQSVRLAFGVMANEITSVGYWYQREPHQRFYNMPAPELRSPDSQLEPGRQDVELLPEQQLTLAVIGPFAGDIHTEFEPEKKVDLQTAIKTNYTGAYKTDHPGDDDRMVRWEKARTTLGWIDYEALYKPKMVGPTAVRVLPNCTAYSFLRLYADRKRSCEFLLGYDDATRVWHNGIQVADLPSQKVFKAEMIKLKLEEGWNEILIKTTNTFNDNWSVFATSIWFPKMDDFRLDEFRNLPDAPEYGRAE